MFANMRRLTMQLLNINGRLPYSYCHAKCHFDVSDVWVGFRKLMTFCCGKMLKEHNLTCTHNISSTVQI